MSLNRLTSRTILDLFPKNAWSEQMPDKTLPICADHPTPTTAVGESDGLAIRALRQTPSWLVSMVVHMVILLVLALLSLPEGFSGDLRQLVVVPGEEEDIEDIDKLVKVLDIPIEISLDIPTDLTAVVPEQVEISSAEEMVAATMHVDLSEFAFEHAPKGKLLTTVGTYTGDGFNSRTSGKTALIRKYDGTPDSERAVAFALQWLADHQLPDGGWCFDHTLAADCRGACRDKGSLSEARIGATAMALLPFLGAGQTHKDGQYKNVVYGGLDFLARSMELGPNGGSLHESGGTMYSHGLASITLCEAYAMTHDKSLYDPAQAAVNFICYAQHPVGGGWRYEPRTPGDTSVVG